MRRGTHTQIAQKVRLVLLEGPATAEELAAEFGTCRKRFAHVVSRLVARKHVTTVHRIPKTQQGERGPRRVKLYELTPQGRAWVRLSGERYAS